jgi:hypothetical protein
MELSLAVCSDHFTEDQFINSSSRKLKEDVVPTVVHSSCDKNCMLDMQDMCEEEEAVFIGKSQAFCFHSFEGGVINKTFRKIHHHFVITSFPVNQFLILIVMKFSINNNC